MLETSARSQSILDLIDKGQYFILHAARQSGKTTALIDVVNTFNAGDQYVGLHFSVEQAQGLTDPNIAIPIVVDALRTELEWHPILTPDMLPDFSAFSGFLQLGKALSALSAASPRPLVLLIDEADCLWGDAMISFLRQLRNGYINRQKGHAFPHSLALVGLRDIRDYKASLRAGGDTLGTASPFNIITKSLTLRNFSQDEVLALYSQHTEETGQVFPEAVVHYLYEQSQGQPWLVNALGREIVDEILHDDVSVPITMEHARTAVRTIIIRRDTHIDSLLERLKEPRVQRIVEPVMLGKASDIDYGSDDCRYVLDLGILRSDRRRLEPANPIYAEVIARCLSYNFQMATDEEVVHRWMDDSSIDMNALLKNFQQFWRENADIWCTKWDYKEAAPHLILMGFLQRVINGGGDIIREFASGRKRIDLNVRYKAAQYPIELKIYYGPKTRTDGEDQLAAYMDTIGATEGWLIIFDRREDRNWDDKISWETIEVAGKQLHVLGC